MAESLKEVSSSMEALEGSEEGKSHDQISMTSARFAVYCHQEKEPVLSERRPLEGDKGKRGLKGEVRN